MQHGATLSSLPHKASISTKNRYSSTLSSLLKSAASVVFKLTSAVIAIAHVRSMSMKSLSVTVMLLFGRSKYGSEIRPKSYFFLPFLPSVSSFLVSLADFNF